mmetsp:Transcript_10542/g.35786  ORF Transcript_10542/g.35786 Transcript_10542/m.35786 type:complete len:202 (+) Transcript_10542:167-772(+)
MGRPGMAALTVVPAAASASASRAGALGASSYASGIVLLSSPLPKRSLGSRITSSVWSLSRRDGMSGAQRCGGRGAGPTASSVYSRLYSSSSSATSVGRWGLDLASLSLGLGLKRRMKRVSTPPRLPALEGSPAPPRRQEPKLWRRSSFGWPALCARSAFGDAEAGALARRRPSASCCSSHRESTSLPGWGVPKMSSRSAGA